MTRVKRRFQRGSKDFYLVELLYNSDNFNKKIKQKQREVGKKDGEKRGAWKESAKEPLMIYRGFSFITANSPSPQTPNSSWFQRGSRERERERERERRTRQDRATPPTSHLLRVSFHDVGTWGPPFRHWKPANATPRNTPKRGGFSGTPKTTANSSRSFFPWLPVSVNPGHPAISRKMNFERGQLVEQARRFLMFLINAETSTLSRSTRGWKLFELAWLLSGLRRGTVRIRRKKKKERKWYYPDADSKFVGTIRMFAHLWKL